MVNAAFKLKPARFVWFAVKSRQYMKGDHVAFREGFWPTWKKFNNLCLIDLGKLESCDD